MLFQWLRPRRPQPSQPAQPPQAAQPTPTVSEIRQQLVAAKLQYVEVTKKRDALALDALTDATAAERWRRLDESAAGLTNQARVLTAALAAGEEQEAEATRRAEAEARVQQMKQYLQNTAGAKEWVDVVLARLCTSEELTLARDRRDALQQEASALALWSSEAAVRRPFDPLDAVRAALVLRVQRIDRARWIGKNPITLTGNRAPS